MLEASVYAGGKSERDGCVSVRDKIGISGSGFLRTYVGIPRFPTLDGQMAVVLVADIVEIDLFANKKGALVGIVRRCDFWRKNQRDSHVQDDT